MQGWRVEQQRSGSPEALGDDKLGHDPRIGAIGQVSDDSHWDALDPEAVEEVLRPSCPHSGEKGEGTRRERRAHT